jgi:hypothetical protein
MPWPRHGSPLAQKLNFPAPNAQLRRAALRGSGPARDARGGARHASALLRRVARASASELREIISFAHDSSAAEL